MSEQLEYRDGHAAGDVDPVRIDRSSATVRVVVRYPLTDRARARNRFLVAGAIALGYLLLAVQVGKYFGNRLGWWMIFAALWPLGIIVTIIMATIWLRAGWVYVFETDGAELRFETQGYLWTRRLRYPRDLIKRVEVIDAAGKSKALVITTKHSYLNQRFLDGMSEQYVVAVADVLREKLALEGEPK